MTVDIPISTRGHHAQRILIDRLFGRTGRSVTHQKQGPAWMETGEPGLVVVFAVPVATSIPVKTVQRIISAPRNAAEAIDPVRRILECSR